VDVRDLYKNLEQYRDWKLYYEGTVLSITVAGGAPVIQLEVFYGPGATDFKVLDYVLNAGTPTAGIYEGTRVGIWGRPGSMTTITNVYGGRVDQPLLHGDYIATLGG